MNTARIFLERDECVFYELYFIIPLETLTPVIISQFLFFSFWNGEKLAREKNIIWRENRKRKSSTRPLPMEAMFSSRPHTYSPEATLCL
jgi:hypothetical protein